MANEELYQQALLSQEEEGPGIPWDELKKK